MTTKIVLQKPVLICAVVLFGSSCLGDITPAYHYGDWVNDDPETLFNARIVIGPLDNDTVLVYAYGACTRGPAIGATSCLSGCGQHRAEERPITGISHHPSAEAAGW